MGTNLHLKAKRDIQVISTKEVTHQCVSFNLWQTPTSITRKLKASENTLQAYKEWVMSVSEDEEEDVFAKDDIFEEGEPIGKKIVNYGKEHLDELDKWVVNVVESEGYEIYFEAW